MRYLKMPTPLSTYVSFAAPSCVNCAIASHPPANACVYCPHLTSHVHDFQADKIEESGSDGEDGSTSASDDEDRPEGDEAPAARRSSAAQKAKAALEQLQGEHVLQTCPAGLSSPFALCFGPERAAWGPPT